MRLPPPLHYGQIVHDYAFPFDAGDHATAAANTDAVIQYAAVGGEANVISGLFWSYDTADPTGRLTIYDGAVLVFDTDITVWGSGFVPFDGGKKGGEGQAMTITLYAGGVGVIGKLNVLRHWMESA